MPTERFASPTREHNRDWCSLGPMVTVLGNEIYYQVIVCRLPAHFLLDTAVIG